MQVLVSIYLVFVLSSKNCVSSITSRNVTLGDIIEGNEPERKKGPPLFMAGGRRSLALVLPIEVSLPGNVRVFNE